MPMTDLEARARAAWQSWGGYAQWMFCVHCDLWRYCRSKAGKRYICVDCFDQGKK